MTIDGKEYKIENIKPCRNCIIYFLSFHNKFFIFKMFRPGDGMQADEINAWKNSYRQKHAILSRDRRANVYIPRTFAFDDEIRYRGQPTFGVLMEYIGRDAETYISTHHMLPDFTLPDIVGALKYGNAMGFYHMDITERNIIIANGHAWLIDFTGAFFFLNGQLVTENCYRRCYADFLPRELKPVENITSRQECEQAQAYMLLKILLSGSDRQTLHQAFSEIARSSSPLDTLLTMNDRITEVFFL